MKRFDIFRIAPRSASIILCLVLSACLDFSPLYGQNYSVQGQISFHNEANGEPLKFCSFSVKTAGCNWSIEVAHPDPSRSGILSFKQMFDGSNLVSLAIFDKDSGSPKNDSAGLVELSSVPSERTASHIGAIWLAYASFCYFASVTNSRVEPIWAESDTDRRRHATLPVIYTLSESSPAVPVKLDYFDEGFYRKLVQNSPSQAPIKRPPPFDRGFLTASFNVITWTNIGQYKMPLNFSYIYFMPKAGAKNSNDVQRSFVLEGTLSSFQLVNDSDRISTIISKVSVLEDRRVANAAQGVSSVQYRSTNAQVPDESLVLKKPEFANAKRKAEVDSKMKEGLKVQSRVVLSVILGATLIFAALLVKARNSQNSVKQ